MAIQRELSEIVKLANHYASQNQWPNAALTYFGAFEMLRNRIGESEPIDDLAEVDYDHLSDELERVDGRYVDLAILAQDSSVARITRALQSRLSKQDADKLGGMKYMIAFNPLGTQHWIVVYNDKVSSVLEPSSLEPQNDSGSQGDIVESVRDLRVNPEIADLDSESSSFLVWNNDGKVQVNTITRSKAAQLAYILSHMAWVDVQVMVGLYMEHQILNKQGAPAIFAAARPYQWSLAVVPCDGWTLGHFGDVYRTVANGWPGNLQSLCLPDRRVADYVIALICYQRALDVDSESCWDNAHLGAAIVNVRGFVGFQYQPGSCPVLDQLMEQWFGDVDKEQRYNALIDKAAESLIRAQRLQGWFYPWAQMYYAYALLLKLLGGAPDDDLRTTATKSIVNVVDALYIDPTIVATSFEPGELYVNGPFQISLYYIWVREYGMAWAWARRGMVRLFKWHFLPGLDAVLGFQLMANAAVGLLLVGPPDLQSFEPPETPYGVLELLGVSVPVVPISTADECIAFIGDVVTRAIAKSLRLFLKHPEWLNTTLEISLVQYFFILTDFQNLLTSVAAKYPSLRTRTEDIINDFIKPLKQATLDALLTRTNIRITIDPNYSMDFVNSKRLSQSLNDQFTFIQSGKPSWYQGKHTAVERTVSE